MTNNILFYTVGFFNLVLSCFVIGTILVNIIELLFKYSPLEFKKIPKYSIKQWLLKFLSPIGIGFIIQLVIGAAFQHNVTSFTNILAKIEANRLGNSLLLATSIIVIWLYDDYWNDKIINKKEDDQSDESK